VINYTLPTHYIHITNPQSLTVQIVERLAVSIRLVVVGTGLQIDSPIPIIFYPGVGQCTIAWHEWDTLFSSNDTQRK